MQKGRNTRCTLVIGAPGTGKSTFSKSIADDYPKKVLVVCPDDQEDTWRRYKHVQLKEISGLRHGKHQIMYDPWDKNFMTDLITNYKNGMLVWDDAKVYFSDNRDNRMKVLEAMLVRRRHANLDLIFMYHGFSTIPPMIWTYTTHCCLFRTNDAAQRAKDKTFNFDHMMMVAENVNKRAITEPHYCENILLE